MPRPGTQCHERDAAWSRSRGGVQPALGVVWHFLCHALRVHAGAGLLLGCLPSTALSFSYGRAVLHRHLPAEPHLRAGVLVLRSVSRQARGGEQWVEERIYDHIRVGTAVVFRRKFFLLWAPMVKPSKSSQWASPFCRSARLPWRPPQPQP